MNYDDWIERERIFRKAIILQSPVYQRTKNVRLCRSCKEILLCHEVCCPNCGSDKVVVKKNSDREDIILAGEYIRCKLRFKSLKNDADF